MTKQTVLIKLYKEGDYVVAEAIELGVASQGRTLEEALRNIKEAVGGYLEAWPEEKERLGKGLISAITIEL